MKNAVRIFRFGLLVGLRDFDVFWKNWRIWLVAWILRVITVAGTWVLLGRLLGSQDWLEYLLIGQAIIVGPQAAGWAVPSSTWNRYDGIYPMLVIAPSSIAPSIIGRSSIWLLNGIATSLITFLVLATAFRLPLPFPRVLLVPVFVAAISASAYCMALFLGALAMRAPQLRNAIHNTASLALLAFTGVSVPVAFWPTWIGYLVEILPVSHGLAALRLFLDGGAVGAVIGNLALELVVGLGWFGLAILTMDWLANAGRQDGSIELSQEA